MSEQDLPKKIFKTDSREKWRCDQCSFDNLAFLNSCEICDHPKKQSATDFVIRSSRDALIDEKKQKPGIYCPNEECKQFNSLFDQFCKKCYRDLIPEEKMPEKKVEVDLIKCPACAFQNAAENEVCLSCEHVIRSTRRILKKPKRAPRARVRAAAINICSECNSYLSYDVTTGAYEPCDNCKIDDMPLKKNICVFCFEKISAEKQQGHDKTCKQHAIFYNKDKNKTFERCTKLQIDTMYYMHNKCEKLHYRKYKALEGRILKLGYKASQLQNLHHYIIHYAPIIIHMHVNTHFQFFVKDTHYRNQFQTSKSSGSLSHSARTQWEDRMFDKRHHDATGFQRVKYGTMNFTNDPQGVNACVGYGQSYFLLKSHVRDRCTITDMDSSSPAATLGTFRFVYHLLNKLSDAELNSAFEGSKGKQMKSHVIGAYKEIQIHGPVEFSKDVERVYISKDELKLGKAEELLEMVKQFCKKHQIEYELFERPKVPHGFPGFGIPGRVEDSVEGRVIEVRAQLTQEELKPPPPPPVPAFGGFGASGLGAGGFGFGGGFVGGFGSFGGFGGFGSFPPPAPTPPKKSVKKAQFGVDYI